MNSTEPTQATVNKIALDYGIDIPNREMTMRFRFPVSQEYPEQFDEFYDALAVVAERFGFEIL